MSHVAEGKLLDSELLGEIREKFAYIDTDPLTKEHRIFLDNAGRSFRLKRANERFAEVDLIPDHPMRGHQTAVYLSDIEKQGIDDIRTIFNAKTGAIVPYYTASQAMFNLTGIVAEHVEGTNNVMTALEHPSLYDAAQFYADKFGKELRVAPTNKITGGVDVEEITKLIDKDTLSLNFIYASNISGAILDVETIITANLILSQNVEKRETVDSIILSASEHGGKIISNGKADDWGYSAIFKDLDDVTWELIAWNE
ncbi:aminotransferase class V-fold PLP-dependent enzyme [Jeotgalicoccus huakuii]|nr:aminotransferase class V-fold PLP-dependent enzyme [Jeotgalicoccus huakuii]